MLVITNPRTAQTLELDVDIDSLLPQDSGSREAAALELDLFDEQLAFDLLPEDEITLTAVAGAALVFGGQIRVLTTDALAIGRKYHLIAYDYSTLLDRINVVADDRPEGESDHDRLVYFMTTYGAGLLDADGAGIATLNAAMPAQKFRLLTLRQAIEQVLGSALETATYRINAAKKLDTWDTAPGLEAAPYDVVLGTPGAGQIAPENLQIKADTTNLFNAYWVRGATAAGSGWFTDPASIAQWDRREKYIDAPDADLAWKAYNVGHAALADTAQPKYRGTFTAYDGAWRSNQRFALTSPIHGPVGGFVAEPFDVVRVSRRYLSGTAIEAMDIEFGSPKASFAAKHGKEARRADGVGPGSGGWGPIGGAGGALQEDGCCPPFTGSGCGMYDTFTRTVSAGGGTGDYGQVWSNHLAPGGSDYGVNGAELFCGLSGGTFEVRTQTGPWQTQNVVELDARIAFYQQSGVFANYGAFQMYLNDGTNTLGWSFSLNGTTLNILSGPGNFETYTYPAAWRAIDYGTGTLIWFRVKWLFDVSTGNIAAKIWLETDPEPSDYQVVMPAALIAPLAGTIWFNVQVGSSFANRAEYVSQIGYGPCAVPGPGQPVVGEVIGIGDGVTTAFATAHPYAPGSLQLSALGLGEPAITETDPSTGAFAVDSPPFSGEVLRGNYQGAHPS